MSGVWLSRTTTAARCTREGLLAAALIFGMPAIVAAKGVVHQISAALATPIQTITSAGPLNQIFIGNDLSAQIAYTGDTTQEVYPPGTTPGDYGTFVVVANTLYAPDFANHGGSATSNIGAYTPFTPVSQSGVSGSGSAADPYKVTTTVNVGATGLSISQTERYVVGQESYRTDVTINNSIARAVDVILYRVMDCYLGGTDTGYGFVNGSAIGCSLNANNTPPDRIEEIVPLTPGSSYYQARYSIVWTAVGTHAAFSNLCDACASNLDNGAGVSWSVSIPPNGSVTLSNETLFSPNGIQPLNTTKTADAASVAPGGADGYTIMISNSNGGDETVNSITDTLPAGFSYVPGSSTGATTVDPAVAGQALTWTGPFNAPAGGSLTLHFSVTAATPAGTYYNQATADAGASTVIGTGPTAPITVTGGGGVVALSTSKAADTATVQVGANDGYTITVTNPNASAISLNSISDTLPAGFSYRAGSTSGVTTADAAVAAQLLTWSGPFNVPAGGSISLHFGVTVSGTAGTFYNQAVADAGATAPVNGTGPTAPVTVLAGGGADGPVPAPTLGNATLALLGLLLAGIATLAMRRKFG
ncbi:MAG: hypothetical protein ABIO49_14150 [Dokdonella sp.]